MSGGSARSWLRPGLVGLHVFGVVAVAFCVFMGLWQLGAYDSRQEHEQADKREVPRVALSSVWGPDEPFTGKLNHRPVSAKGAFAPASDQVWVTGKEQDGRTGAWLLAPFLVDGDDRALLVVRGWAPEPTDLPAVPAGEVAIDAVLEQGEAGGTTYDPDRREIGSVRIPALTNELPYDLYSGFAISTSTSAAGGLDLVPPPQPGDVSWTVGLRNLAYALQWWVFGAFALFMWWRMATESVAASSPKVA
ncbi:SURF1 family protein [Aeromicrobium sp. NPDC092404]|uniref:SURF1 family protein n=1 Tax=Aeromicrobium sp. NPDC092404 TaxID=3154976 RepID=UPI00342F8E61